MDKITLSFKINKNGYVELGNNEIIHADIFESVMNKLSDYTVTRIEHRFELTKKISAQEVIKILNELDLKDPA